MTEYTVLWVDDDKQRREGKRGGFGDGDRIDVIPMGPMDVASRILNPEKSNTESEEEFPEIDLALVDWYLHKSDDYTGDGPSIEGILRDAYPSVPIYAFSSEYGQQKFDRERNQASSRFAYVTGPHKLSEEDICKDLESYEEIQDCMGGGLEDIISLLAADEELSDKIESALPQEFVGGIPNQENYGEGAVPEFGRWVRQELLQKPGLLWNQTWTATKLGIDPDSFDNYSSSFAGCEYEGIFSHRENRWWQDDVKDAVYEKAHDSNQTVDRVWKDAPRLFGVDQEEQSSCKACNGDMPETVATELDVSGRVEEEFPVHYKCSNIEQSRGDTFEEIRSMVKR